SKDRRPVTDREDVLLRSAPPARPLRLRTGSRPSIPKAHRGISIRTPHVVFCKFTLYSGTGRGVWTDRCCQRRFKTDPPLECAPDGGAYCKRALTRRAPVRFLYYHALGLYLKALLRHKHSVQTAANGPDRRCYRPPVGIVKSPRQRPLDELDL